MESQNQINPEIIVAKRKAQWIKEVSKTISIQERIATSVPWWLIIIAAAAFALSAGHTAGMISKLSEVGYLAPAMIEFGLLWAAFARVLAKQGRFVVTIALRLLEIIFICMAVAANFAGSLSSVAIQNGIDKLSFAAIWDRLSFLPVTAQFEFFLVPLFALAIPVVTWVAGEGLAALFLDRRKAGSLLEEKWREVELEEVRRALYAELINRQMPSREARQLAESMATAYTVSRIKLKDVQRPQLSATVSAEASSKHPLVDKSNVRAAMRQYLIEHPDAVGLSARQLSIAVTGSDRSRTVASEVLRDVK